MKKIDSTVLALIAALVLIAPAALAQNSLSVTSAAAMGNGVAQNTCSGDAQPGPCGLELHWEPGQTNLAFVQDDSPNGETVYRARWFMDLNNFDMPAQKRNFFFINHGLYSGTGNPQNTVLRMPIGFANNLHIIGMEVWDNQLNRKGVPWCIVPSDGPFEVQIEFTAGNVPNPGSARLQIFEGGVETCNHIAAGGIQNGAFNINFQTLLTRAEGGLNTPSVIYIDEFSSFRTLAP